MMDYDELEAAIKAVPDTYLPALLAVIVDECDRRPIFRAEVSVDGLDLVVDGLDHFVKQHRLRTGEAERVGK